MAKSEPKLTTSTDQGRVAVQYEGAPKGAVVRYESTSAPQGGNLEVAGASGEVQLGPRGVSYKVWLENKDGKVLVEPVTVS